MSSLKTANELVVGSLKRMGFIHITGLPIGRSGQRVQLPEYFWGKYSNDGLSVEVRVLKNGEVWLKYSHSLPHPKRKRTVGEVFDYSELERAPIFFHASEFISSLSPATLAMRVADPCYDFQGAFVPDPKRAL